MVCAACWLYMYFRGKNPSPAVGLHAVRHSTPEFGNWCVCNHADADQPA